MTGDRNERQRQRQDGHVPGRPHPDRAAQPGCRLHGWSVELCAWSAEVCRAQLPYAIRAARRVSRPDPERGGRFTVHAGAVLMKKRAALLLGRARLFL